MVKILKTIHIALFGGIIMISLVLFLAIVEKPELRITNFNDNELYYIIILIIASIGGIFIGNTFLKKGQEIIISKNSIKDKAQTYLTFSIIKYALLEGPILIGIIFFMVHENLFFIVVSSAMAVYFVSLHPTKKRIIKDLRITESIYKEIEG